MMIENGTSDDVMIKVTGGPGGAAKESPPKVEGWAVPKKKKVPLSAPPNGYVIHLYVEVSPETVMSDAVKGLKLTKGSNGYAIKVIKNGGRGKP